jgi:DNA-binding SARP family transcriptional activator
LPAQARPHVESLLAGDGTPRSVLAAASLAAAMADLFAFGTADAARVEEAESDAEKADAGWIARLARAALACTERARGDEEAGRVRDERDAAGDRWGAALAGLLLGLGGLRPGACHDGRGALADAALRFHGLEAPVLEALARSALAVLQARRGVPEAAATAASAERLARAVGAHGARALALAAVARTAPAGRRMQAMAVATEQAIECGLLPEPFTADAPGAPCVVELRCFGSFALLVSGMPVDLGTVRPRARSALRLLALHGGRPVHKEVLLEGLWPGTDPDSGLRNLQVAVSSLRQVLPSDLGLGVVRDADSYRLALPDGTRSDLTRFDDAVTRARQAAAARHHKAALASAAEALEAHDGELLADEGPAEWLVAARDHRRADAVAMAAMAADAAMELDRAGEAAEWCMRGLAIDRFADRLWKQLEVAYDAAGDVASAARTRAAYAEVRRELGLS